MKMSTLAIGVVAGTLLGAAATIATENMITPRAKRDIKHYATRSMRAVQAFMN